MPKLTVRLLRHTQHRELEEYLRLYQRSFNPDERVSPQRAAASDRPLAGARQSRASVRGLSRRSPGRAAPAPWFCRPSAWCLGATSSSIPPPRPGLGDANLAPGSPRRSAAAPRDGTGASMSKSRPLPAAAGPPRWRQAGFRFFPAHVAAHLLSPSRQSRGRASSAISSSGKIRRADFPNLLC